MPTEKDEPESVTLQIDDIESTTSGQIVPNPPAVPEAEDRACEDEL